MRNSIAASRAVALRLIGWQTAVALLLAAGFLVRGTHAALAALFGGAVVVLPTAWFALRVLANPVGTKPQRVLATFYRATVVKWLLMAFGFWLGTRWFGGAYLPVLVAGLACFVVNWLVLFTARHF